MKKIFLSILLCVAVLVVYGCSGGKPRSGSLTIYSTLDSDFVEELGREFLQKRQLPLAVQVISKLDDEGADADLVLTEMRELADFSHEDLLLPLAGPCIGKLAGKFKAGDNSWAGVFYDPLVCLVNHDFANSFGTEKLQSWEQLCQDLPVRLIVQNFNTPAVQRSLLCGFVSELGEDGAFELMRKVDRNAHKYVSFPFTSVRLVVSGDGDAALVRRSQVFRYLEQEFPAFVLTPQEGTPAVLYGAGVLKAGSQPEAAAQFVDWLLQDSDVRRINLRNDTGLVFLLNHGTGTPLVRPERVWLNTKYSSWTERDRLSQKWLREIRFSSNN